MYIIVYLEERFTSFGKGLCLCIWEERFDCAFGRELYLCFWLGVYLLIWTSVVLMYVFTFDITREIVKFIIDKRNVFQISVKSDDRAVETGQ
jgi:hypothetical protein